MMMTMKTPERMTTMTTIERDRFRRLYQLACHGAGAEPRREARNLIAAFLRQHDITLREALEDAGLDVGAYFASAPISMGK